MSDRSIGRSLVPVAILALVWGANWPILKLGVAELAPLTFRALTLPFAGLGLLAIAKASGESVRIPRAMWPMVGLLALVNITGWNGLVLFGVQQLPAGRSAILAYTMPVWATLVAMMVRSRRADASATNANSDPKLPTSMLADTRSSPSVAVSAAAKASERAPAGYQRTLPRR